MLARWLAVPFLALLAACKGASSGGSPKTDVDADPLALLPASAVAVANVDMLAIAHSGSEGASVSAAADALVPLGDDTGVVASRDIDRIVIGEYGTVNAEVAVIASGRFDPDRIGRSAKTKAGIAVTAGQYVGFPMYTAGVLAYVPLSPRTLVAGTGDGVRRVLERLRAGALGRTMPPWVVDTLQTKGAEIAVAVDFTTQPIDNVTLGSVSVPWLKGMRVARVIGDFGPTGINVAGTLSYPGPTEAENAAQGMRLLAGWAKMLAPLIGGATLQNLDVHTEADDVLCKFMVDDRMLRMLVSLSPRLLPALSAP